MKKLNKLTEEQITKFPEYVNKWLEVGLSTAPVNLEKAKKAVCRAYELVGLKKPTQFYVANSPIHAIEMIQKLDPTLTQQEIFDEMIYGNHEVYWLSYFDYFQTECGVKGLEKLEGLMELSKHTGWLNVYEDVVVFQHRPEKITFDDQKRLHCQDGPAIRYRDGLSVYAWHGTIIPEEWIENPKKLTPTIALTWPNIEQRRCAAEILGWTKILDQLKCVVIDEDPEPEIGTLIEADIPDIGKERFLRVRCGTGRIFCIPVPPETQTALDGQAWTYGFNKEDFRIPEIRT